MQRELAKKLQLLVNTPDSQDRLQEYIKHRIDVLKNQLTSRHLDLERIRGIQGAIEELQRFGTLRDEVNQIVKEEPVRGR